MKKQTKKKISGKIQTDQRINLIKKEAGKLCQSPGNMKKTMKIKKTMVAFSLLHTSIMIISKYEESMVEN